MAQPQFDSAHSSLDIVPAESAATNVFLAQIQNDSLSKTKSDDSFLAGAGRVGYAVSGGIFDATSDAYTKWYDHVDDAAIGGGIGLGLGSLSKAGRLGPAAATAAGGLMAVHWIKSEITGDRWTGFGNAMSQAYHSGANLESNRSVAAGSIGSFTVDLGVMGVSGGVGFAGARKFVPENWAPKAFEAVKANTLGLSNPMRMGELQVANARVSGRTSEGSSLLDRITDGREGRMGGGDTLAAGLDRPGTLGSGKKMGAGDVMSEASQLLKPKHYSGLEAITEAMMQQRLSRDVEIVGRRETIQEILTENQRLSVRRQEVSNEIQKLEAERTTISDLPTEVAALRKAEQGVETILEGRKRLPQLKEEAQRLERQGEKKDGAADAPGQVQNERLAEVQREIRELERTTKDASLEDARAKVFTAGEALAAKQAERPGLFNDLTRRIEAKQAEMSTLEARGQQLVRDMGEAVKLHNERADAIRADESLINPLDPKVQTKPDTLSTRRLNKPEVRAEEAKVVEAKEPVVEPAKAVEVKDTTAGKPQPEPVEVITTELSNAARKMTQREEAAEGFSQAFEIQRQLRQAERTKSDIESGRKRFPDEAAKNQALEASEVELAGLRRREQQNPAKYAQTLKSIRNYIRSVEEYYAKETNGTARNDVVKEAVRNVERFMDPIDNIYRGVRNVSSDLPRTGQPGSQAMPEMRLSQIKEHLQAKIDTIENAYAKKLGGVAENPVVREMFSRFEAEQLPNDGAVVFFTKDGTFLYQNELNTGRRQGRRDLSHNDHVNSTPAFIDVPRLENGAGADGAGLFRFIGHENRIVGAAILRPVMKDGVPVELPGKNGRGKTMIKKEVDSIIGEVPSDVGPGTLYGNLLTRMNNQRKATLAEARTEAK